MKIPGPFLTGTALGLLCGGLAVYVMIRLAPDPRHRRNADEFQRELTEWEASISSLRQSHTDSLMSHVLKQIERDLGQRPDRTLRPETIDQIAALGYALQPYRISEGDHLSAKKLSPERGHLLLMLLASRIDTTSLNAIFKKTSFANADVSGAFLSDAYLYGIDLKEADLRGAQLQGAILNQADLSYANIWGADMSKADLRGSRLNLADLRWSNLNESDLKNADLEEANMVSIRLRKADLRGAVLEWADLSGALLEQADLTGANMYTATLARAQCIETNLTDCNLTSATLIEANLTRANFTRANMSYSKLTDAELADAVVTEQNWLPRLPEWNVTGAQNVQSRYTLVAVNEVFQLKKITGGMQ